VCFCCFEKEGFSEFFNLLTTKKSLYFKEIQTLVSATKGYSQRFLCVNFISAEELAPFRFYDNPDDANDASCMVAFLLLQIMFR